MKRNSDNWLGLSTAHDAMRGGKERQGGGSKDNCVEIGDLSDEVGDDGWVGDGWMGRG